ncbi:FG-GAP repeat [Burkholderiaceae bacterium]
MKFCSFAIIVYCLSLAACGPGGSDTGSASSTSTALAVQATSYANKNVAGLTNTAVPVDAVTGVLLVPTSVTFGDFFQEGKYSAFVVSTAGQAYFLRQSASGTWTDDSSTLFGTGARNTCSATYAITADFNADGKPDVFLSCSGLSNQLIFLSSGSSYVRTDPGIALDGNRAAAADINGDGVLDLVVTDKNATPQIWKGILTANGTVNTVSFRKQPETGQTDWLSTTTCNGTTLPTNIDTVFLVPSIWDTAGTANTNLILGGIASGGGKPYVRLKKIDTDPVPPYYSACVARGFLQIQEGVNNAALRDIFYQNSKFYLLTAYQPTTAEPSEIQLSSYTINTDGTPVISVTKKLNSAFGFSKQYKYNSSVFQPYEAGCTTDRCSTAANIAPP